MAFNLGVTKLAGFNTFLGLARAGHYQQAGADLLTTAWAGQVKSRAQRLAKQMETGVHQA